MSQYAADTSIAIPLIIATHDFNEAVSRWADGHDLSLPSHALAETFSVITRFPVGMRVLPADAERLISGSFGEPLRRADDTERAMAHELATAGISGGAVYDALVALAARDAGLPLATRDNRARSTYVRLGIELEFVS